MPAIAMASAWPRPPEPFLIRQPMDPIAVNEYSILEHNRIILCHFDTYSTALVFARYGSSVLAPAPLSASASVIPTPDDVSDHDAPEAVLEALVTRFGLDPASLRLDRGFDAWVSSDTGPVRVHLAQFNTFEAPHQAIEPLGGVFKPISAMRGLPMLELNLLRQIFNLIMGGG